ncbi:MAG: MBL fold metallo-hydrolase [Deltaproteobacteria bacterium]|nr:MBL fold metallo-hydrolase [Deltaproteobacteria bacterium]
MAPQEVLDNLLFWERGYLGANHLAWRGPAPVLVDTAYLNQRDQTLGLLAAAGVEPARTSLIITTHTHCDHLGANRQIQDLSGCRVALHPLGCRFINQQDDWGTWWQYYGQEAEFFACTDELADGEVVALGPYEFQVLHTPGHASDGLVLYSPRDKVLISSDVLWERDLAVVTERVEGSSAVWRWLASLERLKELSVRLVLPGHGPAFTDFPAAVARTEARLRRYLAEPREIGRDQLRRIMVYTLLMRGAQTPAELARWLAATPWFPETCGHYFPDRLPEEILRETVEALLAKGVLARRGERLAATVRA